MQRECRHSVFNLRNYFSYFSWKKCIKCGKEFCRETGWFFCVTAFTCGDTRRYICNQCAPNYETAKKIALERN